MKQPRHGDGTLQLFTKTLRDGIEVLAKQTKYGVMPYTFANRTQAWAAAERTSAAHPDLQAFVITRGRPFFVRLMPKGVAV